MNAELTAPITSTTWWKAALDLYTHSFLKGKSERPLVLYNADIDGFAASYFVFKSLSAIRGNTPLEFRSRPIWNYEYDFQWIPDVLGAATPDLLVCVDLPIIQEPEVLRQAATAQDILIYDHHVVPPNLPPLPDNVTFLNPRLLGSPSEDHPASAFTGAAALAQNAIIPSDLLLLAAGLRGDVALARYPELLVSLEELIPSYACNPLGWDSPLGRFTSHLNALFRAHPGRDFTNLQQRLAQLLATEAVDTAVAIFSSEFQLDQAAVDVQREVDKYRIELTQDTASLTKDGVFIATPRVKTFSVGIIATILAKQNIAPVVVVGFEAGERVQFELRIAPNADVDLTLVLRDQLTEFRPVTSGGHPMAAGALVWKRDSQRFADTLRRALVRSKKPLG